MKAETVLQQTATNHIHLWCIKQQIYSVNLHTGNLDIDNPTHLAHMV